GGGPESVHLMGEPREGRRVGGGRPESSKGGPAPAGSAPPSRSQGGPPRASRVAPALPALDPRGSAAAAVLRVPFLPHTGEAGTAGRGRGWGRGSRRRSRRGWDRR